MDTSRPAQLCEWGGGRSPVWPPHTEDQLGPRALPSVRTRPGRRWRLPQGHRVQPSLRHTKTLY